jgi:copper chaperone CopZ
MNPMRTAEFLVTGMSCGGCAESLRGLLAGQAGVTHASVSFDAARAALRVGTNFDAAATQAAAAKAGFTLTVVTAS